MKKILVTGSAGFIGFHLSKALLEQGNAVVGFDSLNEYYDVSLKNRRIEVLEGFANFKFIKGELEDITLLKSIIGDGNFDAVINLAAQAGVRYSIECPEAYICSNLVGFFNVVEACRAARVKHLLFASSSSVYGTNTEMPLSTEQKTDTPVSLYAATKKSNELIAHAYSHMFHLPMTGLRFFTVYGPYGRPDMAAFKFVKSILAGEAIDVYNNGDMYRDFTYIDDIVAGIIALIDKSAALTLETPFKVYNIGNSSPVHLKEFIEIIEEKLGKKAVKNNLPMQQGDVYKTYADVTELVRDTGFKPQTSLREGIGYFIDWYREYYV